MLEIKEIKEILKARTAILSLFADVFLDTPELPKIEKLSILLGEFINATIRDDEKEPLVIGYKWLANWVEKAKHDNALLIKLQQENTRLFYLGKYSVGVTASFYLSEEHVNKRKQWEDIIEFYRKLGFTNKNSEKNQEDSIGVELLFLGMLTERALSLDDEEKLKENLENQIIFYDEYLLLLSPLFCETVYNKADDGGAYQALSVVLNGYLNIDYITVQAMLQ